MAVFPGTTKDVKHGQYGYNTGCRCDICRDAKREVSRKRRERLQGTEPPEHGTSQSYSVYGCRCDVCVEARKQKRDEYKAGLRGKEPPEHGLTGYSIYGCRCEVCVLARKESDMKRLDDPKNYEAEKERCWKKYGIIGFTYSNYRTMYKKQDGRCAICSERIEMRSQNKAKVANVDHDHSTGAVRALLCNGCNRMIGNGKNPDILRKGAAYLEYYEGEKL